MRPLHALFVHVPLLAGSAVMLVPMLWMLSTSVKEGGVGVTSQTEWLPWKDELRRDGAATPVRVLNARVRLIGTTEERVVNAASLESRSRRTQAWLESGATNVEVLAYRVRALSTTDEIGAIWADEADVHRVVAPRWRNYAEALGLMQFWTLLKNTLAITYLGTLGTILSCSIVGYGFSRFRFFGRDTLFLVLLSTLMLPPVVTMIPVYLIFRELGWIDTLYPLFVPAWLGGNAFAVFLFRQYYMTVPFELDDAATIDGCGSFGIYWHVLLPLAKPVLATVGIISFTAYWLDFMTPLIYLNSDRLATLSLGLYIFKGPYTSQWDYLMAATLVVSLPCIVLFLVGQRFFIRGVVMSGLKA